MKRLESMKETLMNCVQGQMGDLASADAKELGEAIDMIKDLSEAIYYCTVTEAMEENSKSEKHVYHYTEPMYRDMDRNIGRMYYDEGPRTMGDSRHYSEREYPVEIRDYREGRSPMSRRMYMESKELHKDKAAQMQELDKYMQELAHDITEMVQGASPEEKQLLQKKLTALSTKIV